MPFESGSFPLNVFRITGKIPADLLKLFGAHAAEKLDEIKDEQSVGWVSGRHLLERDIDDTTSILGGHIHVHLRISQRKVPAALLKAECRKEELEYQLQNKIQHLPSKVRKEIRKRILDKRTPQMPPSVNGVPLVIDQTSKLLFLGSASQKICDIFLEKLYSTAKMELMRLDADEMMYSACKQKADVLDPLRFSSATKDLGQCPGRDFLTWLWFLSETSPKFSHKQYGTFELIVEGPFTLALTEDADGAGETSVRRGNPAKSAEVKAALIVGKKLRKAKICIVRGKEVWKFTFDADRFSFTGMTLPDGEELEANSAFAERIQNLNIFVEIFQELFNKFESAVKPENKPRTEKETISWTQKRDAV